MKTSASAHPLRLLFAAVLLVPVLSFGQSSRVIDVDDPSSNDAPLDDEGDPDDNRGFAGMAPVAATASASSLPVVRVETLNGVAETDFYVSMQPEDNFKAVAGPNESMINGLSAKQSSGGLLPNNTESRIASGSAVITSSAVVQITPMLTVWRKIHLEMDSMGVPSDNYVAGVVTSFDANGWVTTNLHLADLGGDPISRFENGRFRQSAATWSIIDQDVSNGFIRFKVSGSASLVTGSFQAYDDDMDTDVPDPNTSHVAAVFKPAYVEPEIDGAGSAQNNESKIPFPFNVPDSVAVPPANLLGSRGSNLISNDYWSVYLVGAFQGATGSDNDPDSEPGDGRLGGTVQKEAPLYPDNVPYVSMVFSETLRESNLNKAWITAHELGHFFAGGLHESDTSLLANGSSVQSGDFNEATLRRIRNFKTQ